MGCEAHLIEPVVSLCHVYKCRGGGGVQMPGEAGVVALEVCCLRRAKFILQAADYFMHSLSVAFCS